MGVLKNVSLWSNHRDFVHPAIMGAQRMRGAAGGCLAALIALTVGAAPALAVPPTLSGVGQQDRHPTATFAAPRSDSVTVYIASSPDRATDGTFLQENVVELGFLTDSEIQAGRWVDGRQINPGSYFVMLRASRDATCDSYDPSTFAEVIDPSCADGFSAVMPLTIPTPNTKYTVKSEVLKNIRILYLTFSGNPLGVKTPYRVCWKHPTRKKKALKKKKKKCVNGTLDGYSWSDDASDSLRISTKRMTRRTKFTWSSRGAAPKVLRTKTIVIY